MNPGDFRHLVDIVAPGTQVPDEGGGYTEGADVVVVEDAWAMIEGLTGNEQIQAMQTRAEASHRVTLREWYSGVKANMTVLFESRRFEIVAPPVDPLEKRERLELMTRELI